MNVRGLYELVQVADKRLPTFKPWPSSLCNVDCAEKNLLPFPFCAATRASKCVQRFSGGTAAARVEPELPDSCPRV